jgi:hypothetical protein
MGLGWSLQKVSACATALVLGGALASACGGQAYTDPLEGFGGSAGSISSGARGGAAGAAGRSGSGASAGRGGASGSSGIAGSGGIAGGGVGGSAAIGGGAGGGPARTMGRPCNSPVAISGGWVQCADGLLQRSEPAACTSRLPRPAPDLTGVPQELIGSLECVRDGDCTERPNGYCAFEIPVRELPRCEYGCVTDDECGPAQVCLCGTDIGVCAPATCVRGAACAAAFACLQTEDDCGRAQVHCETPLDDCRSNLDCVGGRCAWNGQRRVCTGAVGCTQDP